ncbi:hypothetical protein PPL_12069 [Heterostelium album PN500]|uniref:SAP30-binding protein n=1 Tax=Heterostelium pallidum (strain ATCC 26659 / Pp 5 / PN500) TaxID=670386 RepID=D3BLL6_HETP5|nr:hypothetical protein PPL_12069 [Heterostelium album PN500]EFA77467.1 hypothetical protein PPL_12069 [Heterostelium album PN500]|eukprot:XP_020429595.1 hypothetical protein PPL_12069 [Heterostelium album PN500]
MSLFQCYGSDSEDEENEKHIEEKDKEDLDNHKNGGGVGTDSRSSSNLKDINDKDYSEYDSVAKLSIEKVLQKPYGIKVQNNDEEDDDDDYKQNGSNNNNDLEMEDCEPDRDLMEQETADYETRRKKKPRYLEPLYSMRNDLIHTTLENSTPPISSDNRTPPTPTLYSPPYISNPPTSTNPNFTGLYPNISSPTITTSSSSSTTTTTTNNHNNSHSSSSKNNNNDQEEEEDGKGENNDIDEHLREKIIKLHKMKQEGLNFNDSLRNSIAFNNPLILEKLISFCEIKENGSNLPMFYFNPDATKPDEYYDKIEAKQREMEEKKEKERLRIDSQTPPKPTAPQTKKKSNWNKYSQAATTNVKPTVVTKSVKVGAVITSAPTIVKKKEEEKPVQINSIFKRRK